MSKIDDEFAVIMAALMSTRDNSQLASVDLYRTENEMLKHTKTWRFVVGILCSAIYAVGFFYFGLMAFANGDMVSICVAATLFMIGIYCICRKSVRRSIQIVWDRWHKD